MSSHVGRGCGMIGRRIERRVPRIVAVEPSGVRIAVLHPGVGAGDRLNERGAWLAMGLVAAKRAPDILAAYLVQTASEHGCVLDGRRCALRHVRRHRMRSE